MKNTISKLLKTFLLLFAVCNLQSAFSQVPQKMSYQAIIRNSSNVLIASTSIRIKVSILENGATGFAVYSEDHLVATNPNGLATFNIGAGTVLSGSFSAIDWANGNYYIKTETDPTAGTNYTIVGTSQLTSVPYAFAAKVSQDNKWEANVNGINNISGNVGIGNIDPDAKLTILSNSSGDALKIKSTTQGFIQITMDDSGPDDVYLSSRFGDFNIWTGGNNVSSLSVLTNGNVGIGTSDPTTKLEVNGFTKSGSDAPAVKVLKLTGTTSNFVGNSTLINHNLISEKILAVNVLVGTNILGKFCTPNNDQSSFQEYSVNVNPNDIEIKLGFNSSDILGRPIKIMITYEQ